MFKTRLITGLVLIVLVLAAIIYLPLYYFLWISSVLMLWAAWEWGIFIGFRHVIWRILYIFLVAIFMWLSQYAALLPILMVNLVFWLITLYWVLRYPHNAHYWSSNIMKAMMGILTLVPAWLSLNIIRASDNGVALLLFMLCLIWSTDTGAYFSGKGWGKIPLLPEVSPKKTREGLYGGIILTIFIAFIGCIIFKVEPIFWPIILLLGFVVALFSVLGDLVESMLKRQAQIKNTAEYLPGHGGLLDRIDSLLAAAPVFLLYFLLFRFLWK